MKAFVASVLVAYLPLASAGVSYEISSRDLIATDAKPALTRGYAQSGKLREERTSSVEITTARSLITINISARNYQLLDKETLTRIGARERASHEKNVAQRARLPANAREMLERVDANTRQALAMEKQPLDYRPTDRHEIVAGFSCSIWEYYLERQQGG